MRVDNSALSSRRQRHLWRPQQCGSQRGGSGAHCADIRIGVIAAAHAGRHSRRPPRVLQCHRRQRPRPRACTAADAPPRAGRAPGTSTAHKCRGRSGHTAAFQARFLLLFHVHETPNLSDNGVQPSKGDLQFSTITHCSPDIWRLSLRCSSTAAGSLGNVEGQLFQWPLGSPQWMGSDNSDRILALWAPRASDLLCRIC